MSAYFFFFFFFFEGLELWVMKNSWVMNVGVKFRIIACTDKNNIGFRHKLFLAPLPMVNIFLSLFVLLECVLMLITSTTETYF